MQYTGMKILNVIVSGCSVCPAYSFWEEDQANLPHHICNLGASGFPTDCRGLTCPEHAVDPGYFATDCPLPVVEK
jgi:hypothetical protein